MAHSFDFTKSIYCLITGASRGIGRTIAIDLARRSSNKISLVLLARSEQGLLETKSMVESVNKQVNVTTIPVDLSQVSNVEFEQIINKTFNNGEYESASIFHNAGSIGNIQKVSDLSDSEEWKSYYGLNVISVAVLNAVFVKKLQGSVDSITVVNITSLIGRKSFKYFSMYGSAKAARDLYFKVFAAEEPNIVVLNYSPGMVATSMASELVANLQNFKDNDILPADNTEPTKLAPEQTVQKMFSLLENPKFQSGIETDMFQEGLIFLMNLAWESRLRLPLLLTCAFMALNVRMQLEINVYTQNNGRNRLIEVIQEAVETVDSDSDDSDSHSWQTTDEWEAQSHTSDELEVAV